MRLLPADAGFGVRFRRVDLDGSTDIPATVDSVQCVPRRTVLGSSPDCVVETVEHVMSALAGLQVDNCLVEINAPEVPAFDGSCREVCDGILEAGLEPLDQRVQSLVVETPLLVQNAADQQSIAAGRCSGPNPKIIYELDYQTSPLLSGKTITAEVTPVWFYDNISAARTFVLEAEIGALQQMGYGLHLTTKDIVVIGQDGPIDNELRWPDEGVRHKILDCIGDLALSGRPWHADISARRSGHHMNHEMARKLTELAGRTDRSGTQAA